MATAQVESRQRMEPGSHHLPFGNWPEPAKSTDVDCSAVARDVVDKINKALSEKDTEALADLFASDSYLRDHLVNSWDVTTLKGSDNIYKFLSEACRLVKLEIDDGSAFKAPHLGAYNASNIKGVEFFVNFESVVGTGRGVCRLIETDGKWCIWTLFIALTALNGHEELAGHRRPSGVSHGADTNGKNWQDRRDEEENFTDSEPAVLVVGAGQGGLAVAARLKMLDVPTLIVDMNDRVGDNWRKRYSQLVLHDPVWYDHLPYVNFPSHWPVFTPKDKLAEWFESYAKTLELNVWMKTKIESGTYDDSKRQWTVEVTRTKPDGTTEKRTLHPRHIIQATGHSGKKHLPDIKGMSTFQGTRLVHSADFSGATPNSTGKKAVVVGACNSAHDICQDLHANGYAVTMVQRSSTCVVSSSSVTDIAMAGLYCETGPPVDDADLWFWSVPNEVLKSLQAIVTGIQADHDATTLAGLARAGFRTDRGPDDAGVFIKYFQRGGGYYIDVGASRLIADGEIAVASGRGVAEVLPHGLRLDDGTELPADELVFATGYGNMRDAARDIFGPHVHARLADVWGFDARGEIRTIWRRSGHPGYWFMGGNLALCRYWSRVLALQIKALEEGIASYDDR